MGMGTIRGAAPETPQRATPFEPFIELRFTQFKINSIWLRFQRHTCSSNLKTTSPLQKTEKSYMLSIQNNID